MRRSAFVLLDRTVSCVVVRLGLRRFRGGDLLQLTTTGRTSGQRRTVPLLHVPDLGGPGWIAAASDGGADRAPGWWLNLQAADSGVVTVDGRRSPSGGGARGHRAGGGVAAAQRAAGRSTRATSARCDGGSPPCGSPHPRLRRPERVGGCERGPGQGSKIL